MRNLSKTIAFLCFSGLLFCIIACRNNKDKYYEMKDKDMKVQVILENIQADTGDLVFKVRLLPEPAKGITLGKDKGDFYYHMDSCFYLNSVKGKVYALLVEPIANGLDRNYEYLLNFERIKGYPGGLDFVYRDRYINHKTYQIKLN